uniref:Uncharacterized protein n=1 Tax=Lepeophtheirus salmonis TaxID=72036 RepID=A0A0K2TW82_LEPSM
MHNYRRSKLGGKLSEKCQTPLSQQGCPRNWIFSHKREQNIFYRTGIIFMLIQKESCIIFQNSASGRRKILQEIGSRAAVSTATPTLIQTRLQKTSQLHH